MIDKNVQVKSGVTLEENLIASTFTITTNSKGVVSFAIIVEQSESELLDKGAICYLPLDM